MLSLTKADNTANVAEIHRVHGVLLQQSTRQKHFADHTALYTFVVPGVLEKVFS